MAMTLPIALPSTPPSGQSPASDDGSNPPRSPVSPDLQTSDQSASQQQAANAASAQMKRKPSRRANTAERRATHNAVERQRRETLNGRFLDLAALLPNLSQIRRPSKSSIVNSSIAHIHASRRHRILAARELRLIKLEADALRRELNEWRDRASIPRIEEPIRGDGFSMVLSGELEVIAAVQGDDDDDENMGGYGGYGDEADDDFGAGPINSGPGSTPGPVPSAGGPSPIGMDEMDDPRLAMMKSVAVGSNGAHFTHAIPPPPSSGPAPGPGAALHLAHILPRQSQGTMAPSPTSVFDSPAIAALYESQFGSAAHYLQQQQQQHHQQQQQQAHHHHQQQQQQHESDKMAAWNVAQLYAAQQSQQQQHHQMLQAQRSLFTPPATSHGLPGSISISTSTSSNASNSSAGPPSTSSNSSSAPNSASANGGGTFADQAFFATFQRQQQAMMHHHQQQQQQRHQQQQQQHMGGGHGYGSPERDDVSSVGSGGRERSRSLSGGSAYGSPGANGSGGRGSPAGGYEIHHGGHGHEYAHGLGGVPKRMGTGVPVSAWRDVGELDMGGLASPVSAGGGGGNAGGFAMIM